VADSESASSATPQEDEAVVDEVAFRFPAEVKVVVAVDEAAFESSPVGTGEPLAQGWVFEVLTEPPDPLPVE
jgi:hypothetical protein